jgi:D-aspartate ligase
MERHMKAGILLAAWVHRLSKIYRGIHRGILLKRRSIFTSKAAEARPYAVVIGLESIQGLQTARILARHNVPVIGLTKDLNHPYCRTNACQRILMAETEGEQLIACLQTLGPEFDQKAVLYPCGDTEVLLLSRHRQQLADWYHVVLPEPAVVELLLDKVHFYTYAQEQGLPVPPTFILESRADAERAAANLIFPCVVKPALKSSTWREHVGRKVDKLESAEALLAFYDHYAHYTETLLVQQWIAGSEENLYTCNCYFSASGQPLVTFVARKLRQWPPDVGTGSLREECRNDTALQQTVQLFANVNYRGLGYVEVKRDARSGQHFIVEPNIGRPTGGSAIAEAGGVELLYTMYCDVTGRPLPEQRQQTYGNTKWIYLNQDIRAALYHWRNGDLSLAEWGRSWRGRRFYADFSWLDLMPTWEQLKRLGLALLKFNPRNPRNQRDAAVHLPRTREELIQ